MLALVASFTEPAGRGLLAGRSSVATILPRSFPHRVRAIPRWQPVFGQPLIGASHGSLSYIKPEAFNAIDGSEIGSIWVLRWR